MPGGFRCPKAQDAATRAGVVMGDRQQLYTRAARRMAFQ